MKPKLDASEVASCRWVPLTTFHENARIDHVSYPMNLSTSRAGPRSLTLGTMDFPGIILPSGEEFFPDPLNDSSSSTTTATSDADPVPARIEYTYHLWGITLDIVEDLSVHLRLCQQRGTISYLPRSLNPLVMLYIWHHHYIPHSLKGAPFWSGVLIAVSAVGYLAWRSWNRKKV